MTAGLLDRLGRPVTLVVGKGGVGKSTTAGGLALATADSGRSTRLISVDPAHSLADLFGHPIAAGGSASPCTDRLVLEELDAVAEARRRLGRLEPALAEIIELGTYLDEEDAALLVGAALPGLDEIGAALRIAGLAGSGGRLVVDTAPTGHALRLLDAEATVRGWLTVFEAMARKADAVASGLLHAPVRLRAESDLEALATELAGFSRVIRDADFIVVTGAGRVVEAETRRLLDALERRGMRVAATVAPARPGARADVLLPVRPGLAGCEALRSWWAEGPVPPEAYPGVAGVRSSTVPAGPIPAPLDRELVIFAGKGGVGKTTCAAALAVRLAADGPVTVMGADPAGSLLDVIGAPVTGLTVVEADAESELERLRSRFRDAVEGAFDAIGLDHAAGLDRAVIESLWDAAPPGLDELAAVARLLEGGGGTPGRQVLDAAPTGHFLRLVGMPGLALDWVHRIMRILLHYLAVSGVDAPAEGLLRLARQLRALRERLADPARTSIVVVSTDEPMVRAETGRLVAELRRLGLPVGAIILNRAGHRDAAGLDMDGAGVPVLRAPNVAEPVGPDALAALFRSWEIDR